MNRRTTTSQLRPPGSNSVRRAGFSLIELMVVIVLIGITASLIIPEMKGSYEDALLRSASRELVDAFNLAYSQAVSLNQAHRVRIEERTGQYYVEKVAARRGPTTVFAPVKDLPGSQGRVSDHITLHVRKSAPPLDDNENVEAFPGPGDSSLGEPDSNTALVFNPDGTTDSSEIVLKDRHGFGLVLRLNPVTSRVHISELPHQ